MGRRGAGGTMALAAVRAAGRRSSRVRRGAGVVTARTCFRRRAQDAHERPRHATPYLVSRPWRAVLWCKVAPDLKRGCREVPYRRSEGTSTVASVSKLLGWGLVTWCPDNACGRSLSVASAGPLGPRSGAGAEGRRIRARSPAPLHSYPATALLPRSRSRLARLSATR